jgi:dihydroorotate dehydrogenase (NAD+) catalytic subunit
MVELGIEFLGMRFRNPTILASGILGSDGYLLRRVADCGIGGLTTKSFTLEAREGYDPPIIAYVDCGLINAVGLSNPGCKAIPDILSIVRDIGIPVIVSIAGSEIDEFNSIAVYAEEAGADAVELNLSCPHVKGMGLELQHDPSYVGSIVSSVAGSISIPTIIKIGLSDNYLDTVSRALDKGASGVTAINTVRALAIDIYAKKPILSNIYGGLSGLAIHPIALRVVYDVYKEFGIPIIGMGGVMSWREAIEFILAGASAVGIGTAIAYYGLDVVRDVVRGIEDYLSSEGFESIDELVGYAVKK